MLPLTPWPRLQAAAAFMSWEQHRFLSLRQRKRPGVLLRHPALATSCGSCCGVTIAEDRWEGPSPRYQPGGQPLLPSPDNRCPFLSWSSRRLSVDRSYPLVASYTGIDARPGGWFAKRTDFFRGLARRRPRFLPREARPLPSVGRPSAGEVDRMVKWMDRVGD
jgi:hypothetical protein